jgi:hypothetical protein
LKDPASEVVVVRSIRKKWLRLILDKWLPALTEAFRYGIRAGADAMDGPAFMSGWTGIDLKLKCLSRCRHAQPDLVIEVASEVLSYRGGFSLWEDLYAGGHEAIACARVRSNRQELVDFYCRALEMGISASAAAEALGLLRAEDASDALIAAFRNSNRPAAKALGRAGGPNALPALIAGLDDPDWFTIESAVLGLAELRDEHAVPHLVPLLGHRERQLRWRVADALGRIGSPAAVEPLLRALDDIPRETAEALGRIQDPRAAPALIELLASRDRSVRNAAVEALGRLDTVDTYRAIGMTREDEGGPIPVATISNTGESADTLDRPRSVELREPSSPSTSSAPTRCEEHRRWYWILIRHIFRIVEIISRPLVGVSVLYLVVLIGLVEFLVQAAAESWAARRARRILRDPRRH